MFHALSLAALLVGALACRPTEKAPTKADDDEVEGSEAKASPKLAPVEQPGAPLDEGFSSAEPEADRGAPPPWFDAAKIEHQQLIRQDHSKGKVGSGYAAAMVLELRAGVTAEQCIERASAVLGQSISDLPAASPGAGGRLTIQGKTDAYAYTVVCGVAKGKPTMYLSYNEG